MDGLSRQTVPAGVTISRSAMALDFPWAFLLVCAMSPCHCTYQSDSGRRSKCDQHENHRHRSRISGPLLDRIDLLKLALE